MNVDEMIDKIKYMNDEDVLKIKTFCKSELNRRLYYLRKHLKQDMEDWRKKNESKNILSPLQ